MSASSHTKIVTWTSNRIVQQRTLFKMVELTLYFQVNLKKPGNSWCHESIQVTIKSKLGINSIYLQHLSQKNLSSAFNVSVELKFFKQLVIELFCSISRLKSKNVSSLAVTVSHRRHLVSLVSIPWSEQFTIMRFLKKGRERGRECNRLNPIQSSQFIIIPSFAASNTIGQLCSVAWRLLCFQ